MCKHLLPRPGQVMSVVCSSYISNGVWYFTLSIMLIKVGGNVYHDVDLSKGEWFEYDVKGSCPVSISKMKLVFEVVKTWSRGWCLGSVCIVPVNQFLVIKIDYWLPLTWTLRFTVFSVVLDYLLSWLPIMEVWYKLNDLLLGAAAVSFGNSGVFTLQKLTINYEWRWSGEVPL